jgi:hypothetical protein
LSLANRITQEITSRKQKLATDIPGPKAVETRDMVDLLKILRNGYLDLTAELKKANGEN